MPSPLCPLTLGFGFAFRIGAGTGIFTRALLANPDWSSAIKELRAVEPSAGMRSVFSKAVTDPRVSVEAKEHARAYLEEHGESA